MLLHWPLLFFSFWCFFAGLDDLRDWTNNVQPYIPIYVAERDFEVQNQILSSLHQILYVSQLYSILNLIVKPIQVMKKTHYYLIDTSGVIPGAAVSDLQFNIINEEPFTVHDLKVTIIHFRLKSNAEPVIWISARKSNMKEILSCKLWYVNLYLNCKAEEE